LPRKVRVAAAAVVAEAEERVQASVPEVEALAECPEAVARAQAALAPAAGEERELPVRLEASGKAEAVVQVAEAVWAQVTPQAGQAVVRVEALELVAEQSAVAVLAEAAELGLAGVGRGLAEEAAAGLGLVAAPEAVEVALEAPAAGQG
jgi:hypothetical protein